VLLDSQFLPIKEHRVRVKKLPLGSIHALVIDTSDWFSELELLLYIGNDASAFLALKGSKKELRFNFSGASDCSMNRHKAAEALNLQVTNFLDSRHVVVSNLEVSLLSILMTKIIHKLSDSLAQVHFEPIVLFDEPGDKREAALIFEPVVQQVREIDEHRDFFVLLEFLCLKHIVLDGLP
jgi:hypothetical protein